MTSPRSVAAGLCASTLQLSSPATTPTLSSSVGSGWLLPGYAPGTSACARQGLALLSSCDGCPPLHRCSYHLPALHAGSGVDGRAASAVQLVITVPEQTGEVQEASPGADEEEVLGEPEHGGYGCLRDAVEVEHGIAVGR